MERSNEGECFHAALLCYIMLCKITLQPSLITSITTSTTGLAIYCNLNASNLHSKWCNWIPPPLFETALKSLDTVLETILKPTPTFTIPSGTFYVHVPTKHRYCINGLIENPNCGNLCVASIILFADCVTHSAGGSIMLKSKQEMKSKFDIEYLQSVQSKLFKADRGKDHIALQTN